MEEQKTILDRFLQPTFKVSLTSIPDVELGCRDLPFTTLMYALGKIAEVGRSEILGERERILKTVAEVAAQGNQVSKENIIRTMQMMWPILSRIVMQSEEMTLRVFRDVIVGANDDHIRAIPVVDLLAILDTTFARIEPDLVAERVQSVFTQAMVVWDKVATSKDKDEQIENGQEETPSSQQKASAELEA